MSCVDIEKQRARWREQYYRKRERLLASGAKARAPRRKRYSSEEEREAAFRESSRRAARKYRSKQEVKQAIRERERVYFRRTKHIQYAKRAQNIANNPSLRIKRNLRARLWDALRRDQRKARGGSAVRDLGCSIEFFKEYIAGQFQEGMSWDNWGEWHIDHIKPLYNFDLTVREQVIEACHYTNMRPLWAKENLSRPRRLSSATNENGGVL